jgi:hypothetical protein
MDEDEIEDFWANVEKMDHVWGYLMEVCSVLMRNIPEQVCSEILTKVWPHYDRMLSDVQNKKDYELIEGTCFLVDCIELGTAEMVSFLAQSIVPQKFFEILQHKSVSPVLCQNSVFGLGEFARRSFDADQTSFPPLANCLQAVEFVLTRKFEDEDGPVNCYDNAISTLGKLIYFQGHNMAAQL